MGTSHHCAETTPAGVPKVKLVVLLLFVGLFFLMAYTVGNWPLPTRDKPVAPSSTSTNVSNTSVNESDLWEGLRRMELISTKTPVPFLTPWGEDRLAVYREWTHIYRSIQEDIYRSKGMYASKKKRGESDIPSVKQQQLEMLVYDVDEGYFSLSVARYIPEVSVTAVLLDKCARYSSKLPLCNSSLRSVEKIEKHWEDLRTTKDASEAQRFFLCLSSKPTPVRLEAMGGRHALVDYQIALSLFEQFKTIPRKVVFQQALISLLKSASIATFITLPNFRSAFAASLKKGGTRVPQWYESAKDPEDLIREAADIFSTPISISRLCSERRGSVERTVFRVEVLRNNETKEAETSRCEARREFLHCDSRTPFLKCSS